MSTSNVVHTNSRPRDPSDGLGVEDLPFYPSHHFDHVWRLAKRIQRSLPCRS